MAPPRAALTVAVENGTARFQLKGMLHAHVMHEGLESFARKRKHPMAGKADKTRTPDGTVHETISSRPTLGVGNLYHGSLRREALERSINRRLAHTLLAIQKVVVNLIDRKRLASMRAQEGQHRLLLPRAVSSPLVSHRRHLSLSENENHFHYIPYRCVVNRNISLVARQCSPRMHRLLAPSSARQPRLASLVCRAPSRRRCAARP